jgi:hypothetical protein
MPWPDYLIWPFARIDRSDTNETEWYGPFNSLLFDLFPVGENYMVTPVLRTKGVKGSMYFAIYYIPEKRIWEEILVCFVDVRTYRAYDYDSARKRADDYMRDRFLEFASEGLALAKLYGISALGTRYAVYEYRTRDRALMPTPEVVDDTAPQERWNYDLFEPEGEAKFKQLVGEIKEMVATLRDVCKPLYFHRSCSDELVARFRYLG